jgi:PAS domain S-box-containing protein
MLTITGVTLFLGAFILIIYIYQSQVNLINTIQSNQKKYIINQLDRAEKESIEQENNNIKQLVLILSGSIGNALYALNTQAAEDTLATIYQRNNIKAIVVHDNLSNNNFLVKSKDTEYTKFTSVKNDLKNEEEIIGTLEIFYDNSYILNKIKELKNRDLKAFELETKQTSKILNGELKQQIIWFVLWSLLIMLLLAVSLVILVNKPLQKFKMGLESFFRFLEDSKSSVQEIDIKSNDEFGAMSLSTNKSINVSMQLHSEITNLMNVMDKNIITSETDDKGIITYVSNAFCEISGYTREELLGQSHKIVRHPDMPKEVFADLWETIKANRVWKGEIKNRKKDGGFYWVDAIITPKCTKNGASCGYTAIGQDITAKKEVDDLSKSLEQKVEERTQDLKEQQQQFKSMVSNVPGAIYRAGNDSAWPIYYFSDEIENITGYSAKDFMESKIQTFSTIMYPDDIAPIGKIIQEQFAQGKKFQVDYRIITKSGDIKWVRSQGQSIESQSGEAWIDGVLIDITEQKELENENKENQEKLSFALRAANMGTWQYNIVENKLIADENGKRLYGLENIELDGTIEQWFTFIHPDDMASLGQAMQDTIQNQKIDYQTTFRVVMPHTKKIHHIMSLGKFSYGENKEPLYASGLVWDITDIKVAQEKVEENRLFLNTLLDSQEQLIITTDGKTLITANETFFDFYAVDDIPSFIEEYNANCICETFNKNAPEGYLQIEMNGVPWIDHVLSISYSKQNYKAMITRGDTDYIFSVTAAKLPGEEGLKSAVFTDITAMEMAKQQIEAIHKHTRESIEYAALIQGALIPDEQIFNNFFEDSFAIWQPKDIVGGDIYLMNQINDDELIIMVIDCTGHGVPGAFVTMLVKAIERQLMANIHKDETISPAKILSIFNRSIKNLLKQETIDSVSNAGFDGGIIYYNKKEKIIKYAGAETALFYVDENEELQTIKGSRHSVGYKKSDATFEFKEHTIDVKEGMQFYCTTDGYLDQNGGEKGFPFGKKRFENLILEYKDEPMADQQEVFLNELDAYQGNEETNDDVTLVGFKI